MAPAPPIAKVSRPVSMGYVPRPRLYRLLDRCSSAPLVWITGPPGCGKTALASSYVESRRLAHLWYKLDEGDADLATFFYYLGLAARKALPRRKVRLPVLTPDRVPGLLVFARRYFEALSSLLPVPSVLVLDDCHRIPADAPFFEILRDGVSCVAPGVRTILVSRADPAPCFARERANRGMEVLGWEELRVTPAEAVRIARRVRGRRSIAVRDLLEWTNGWAAGLVLLLQRHDATRVEPRGVAQRVPAIVDYFGTEIFRRLDDERRSFLMRSAFLPRMTTAMAEKISGNAHARRMLADLNRQNLFTEKNGQQEPVYEYHALFRDFLLERASAELSPEALRSIRTTAAAVLEEAGYAEDAAALLRDAGDWPALGELVKARASGLCAQGRHRTVLSWISGIPAGVQARDPWILYWAAHALLPSSAARSRELFQEAFRGLDERHDAYGAFRAWVGVVDASMAALDRWSALDEWVLLLPRLLDRYHGFPSEEVRDDVTCTLFTVLVDCRPAGIDVDAWAERAIAISRTTASPQLKIKCALVFFLYKLGTGGFREAEAAVASIRALVRLSDESPVMRIWLDWCDAVQSIFVARPDRAARLVSDALAFAREVGIHLVDPLLVGYGALAALHLGDGETASRHLATMRAALPDAPQVIAGLYQHIFACDALGRGDPRQAVFHGEESLKQMEAGRTRAFLPVGYLLASHAHEAAGEHEPTATRLADARRAGVEADAAYVAWMADLSEAYFAFRRGDDAAAIPVLVNGMRLGREHGLLGTFFWRPGFLETIAARALEHGIEADYARDLVRRNRLRPNPADLEVDQWPWPVKVRTLGGFELLADGHPVHFGRKVQQRPLSLLKALIALGGREVPVSRLTELLWPDADGDLAHASFTSALNRLRNLLGSHEALILKEGRLSLSAEHCWVDVAAFERFVDRARDARRERREADAARLLSRALDLYRGVFLPSDEAAWALAGRERVRAEHARAAAALASSVGATTGRWIVGAQREVPRA